MKWILSRASLTSTLIFALMLARPLVAGMTFNVDHVDTSDFAQRGYITFYIDYLDDSFRVVEPVPNADNLEVHGNGDLLSGQFEIMRFSELDESVAVALVVGAHGDYTASITGDEGENEISVFDLERDALKSFIKKLDAGANDRVLTAHIHI